MGGHDADRERTVGRAVRANVLCGGRVRRRLVVGQCRQIRLRGMIRAHDAPQTVLLTGEVRVRLIEIVALCAGSGGWQGEQHLEMLRDAHRLRVQMTGIGIGRLGQPLYAVHGEGVVQLLRADQYPDLHLVIGVSAQQRGIGILICRADKTTG